MDFKALGEELVHRRNKAWADFEATFQFGKIYNDDEREFKNSKREEYELAQAKYLKWLYSNSKK